MWPLFCVMCCPINFYHFSNIRKHKQNQTVWLLHCPSKGSLGSRIIYDEDRGKKRHMNMICNARETYVVERTCTGEIFFFGLFCWVCLIWFEALSLSMDMITCSRVMAEKREKIRGNITYFFAVASYNRRISNISLSEVFDQRRKIEQKDKY